MKFLFELNTRIEIPYQQATMYYFVYHINTVALYWEEKPTSLMNENKWIDNPRVTIVRCVCANPSDGKMRRIMITKTKMVVIFQFSKFSFIEFVLIERRSLSGKRPKSARGKSSSCRFSFSAERNANTKAAEYLTFDFSFSILFSSPSRKVWASLSVSDTDFFSRHNSRIFKTNSLYWESWRLCRSFTSLTEWRQGQVTFQQLISYINTRKKTIFFQYVVTAFLRAGNPCIRSQYIS